MFAKSFVRSQARSLHDGLIKAMASWSPDSVGAAQLEEWNTQAVEMAQVAAKAKIDAQTAREALANIQANVTRYTAAAEKLFAAGNEKAAESAVNTGLEWKEKLADATTEVNESEAWEKESLAAAEKAQLLVVEGRDKIAKAKREQERARQNEEASARRLADRERVAGITKGLNGADLVLDAMAANSAAAKQRTEANNIRSGVLGKSTETNTEIAAALAEVDGTTQPKSFADKLAALKG